MRPSGFRVLFVFSFSFLGCSKSDFLGLNCCTISGNISKKKNRLCSSRGLCRLYVFFFFFFFFFFSKILSFFVFFFFFLNFSIFCLLNFIVFPFFFDLLIF